MLRPDCGPTFCVIGLILVSNNAQVSILILYMLSVIKCHFKTMPVYYVGLRMAEHTDFAARKTAGRSPVRFAKKGMRSVIRESA